MHVLWWGRGSTAPGALAPLLLALLLLVSPLSAYGSHAKRAVQWSPLQTCWSLTHAGMKQNTENRKGCIPGGQLFMQISYMPHDTNNCSGLYPRHFSLLPHICMRLYFPLFTRAFCVDIRQYIMFLSKTWCITFHCSTPHLCLLPIIQEDHLWICPPNVLDVHVRTGKG